MASETEPTVTNTVIIDREVDDTSHNSLLSGLVNMDLIKLGKNILILYLIYLMGCYHFSFVWIPVVYVVWYLLKSNQKQRKDRSAAQEAFSLDEKKCITSYFAEDLPSWVYFPDIERAAWLNKIIEILWPYVGHYVEDFVKEKIEPLVQEKVTKVFSNKFSGSFKFTNMILGDKPFVIKGIKVYDQSNTSSRREIIMDLEISYSGDCDFQVAMSMFKAGIKDLQFHGTLRVVMKPLVTKIPLVGALQVFFLKPPEIDFNLTNVANLFDFPAFKEPLLKIVIEVISSMMVLPNKFPLKLVSGISDILLNFPEPKGVIKLNLIEANKLEKKDGLLGNSDPYAIISVGSDTFTSKTINSTTKPVWNFKCKALVYDIHGQTVDFDVMDEDPNADDRLGRFSIDIKSIASSGKLDKWYLLQDAKSGNVHIEATWYSLSSNYSKYREGPIDKDEASSCVLIAYVESAAELPNAKKKAMEPSPYVRFSIDKEKFETRVCKETNHPEWNEGSCFFITKPEDQELTIEVIDMKTKELLGELTYPIRVLLDENDLRTERPFHLNKSGAQSTIKLCLQLKIMVQEQVDSGPSLDSTSQPSTPLEKVALQPSLGEVSTSELLTEPINSDKDVENDYKPDIKPLQLEQSGGNENGTSLRRRQVPQESGKSSLNLTMRYSMQNQTLNIVVLNAVNLRSSNSSGAMDAYVKVVLLPGSPKENKRKTATVKNNSNPVYDEKIEYVISQSELNNHALEISVCSTKSLFARRPVLGKTKISLGDFDFGKLTNPGITECFELKDDNGGND